MGHRFGDKNSSKMELLRYLLQSSLVLLLLLTFSSGTEEGVILQVVEDVQQKPASNWWVPALFAFGDSVLDVGTNNHIPSLLQAKFIPYGTTYFGQPTGRFTNGRVYPDFFANLIGMAFPEPYLARKDEWSIMAGVNYASAGSGILRTSNAENKVVPFPDQILQFNETKLQIAKTLRSEREAEILFKRSLFLINVGASDIFGYIANPSASQNEFIDGLLVILKASVGALYDAGARKVMIIGVGPLGCIPGALANAGVTNGQCVEQWNDVAQAYNAALEELVYGLKETFPNIKAIVGKPYSKWKDFIINGEKYGFTGGLTACCGSGIYNAVVQCGRPADIVKNPPTNLCHDPTKYVFWDFYHPTDTAYGLLAEAFWSGNSSVVAPMNLKTLVSIEPYQ